MTLRSPHEIHEADVNAIKELIAGSGPDDAAERERLLWQLVGIHAGIRETAHQRFDFSGDYKRLDARRGERPVLAQCPEHTEALGR